MYETYITHELCNDDDHDDHDMILLHQKNSKLNKILQLGWIGYCDTATSEEVRQPSYNGSLKSSNPEQSWSNYAYIIIYGIYVI